MKTLILVESPTKAKTLTRFLGGKYIIEASMGHIRDLPKGNFGVDLEHNFEPKYVTMSDVKPPTIVLFVNDPGLAHFSYVRYLENRIRREYSYEGTPLRLIVRKAKKERKAQTQTGRALTKWSTYAHSRPASLLS